MRNNEHNRPTYSIYQLKRTERDLLFQDYASLERKGIEPKLDRYVLKYISEDNTDSSLDEIYVKFNINPPEDFCGHSLSVSDVIVKFDGEQCSAFFVDSFGFKPLPNFYDKAPTNKKDMEM